jgi:hypothetical protein
MVNIKEKLNNKACLTSLLSVSLICSKIQGFRWNQRVYEFQRPPEYSGGQGIFCMVGGKKYRPEKTTLNK